MDIDSAGDDPIIVPQLRERLADIEKELAAVRRQEHLFPPEPVALPRAARFATGAVMAITSPRTRLCERPLAVVSI